MLSDRIELFIYSRKKKEADIQERTSLPPGLPASTDSSFWEPEICPLSYTLFCLGPRPSLFLSISHYHCSDPPSLSSRQGLHNSPGWLCIATAALKSILRSNHFLSYLTKSFPCLSAFNSFFLQKEWSLHAYIQWQARNFMASSWCFSIPISHSLLASTSPVQAPGTPNSLWASRDLGAQAIPSSRSSLLHSSEDLLFALWALLRVTCLWEAFPHIFSVSFLLCLLINLYLCGNHTGI